VGVLALVSSGTVVLVVELLASFLGWLWPGNLALEGVREMAAEAIFAVAHIVVDAWVEAPFNMVLTLTLVALLNGEVLVGAKILDHLNLLLQPLVLKELFVIHAFVDMLLN
jgi:hypothetical protein